MVVQRTIGFDFGTHQTKICIEEMGDTGTSYHFFPFEDSDGKSNYLLPSVVRINSDNKTLSYGFMKPRMGKVVRYFKQATYCTEDFQWDYPIRAEYFTIWYLAYILFFLESEYGMNFTTNMGVPTDTASLDKNKVRAVSVMLSALHLVEDVFKNDLHAFLKCTIDELFEKTEIIPCSKELKESYDIQVFPEAYACLRPLTARRKLPLGMSLMVDIGGGTTDVSFFTIENGNAQIYRFMSIAKGLNYINGVDGDSSSDFDPSTIREDKDLNQSRKKQYESFVGNRIQGLLDELNKRCNSVAHNLAKQFNAALANRPIIFTGGGSTFPSLRLQYGKFTDIHQVSVDTWNISCFPDFEKTGLCPILNTAYGLCISDGATSDDIPITPFETLFDNIQAAANQPPTSPKINLRDGTVDTTGFDIVSTAKPITWKPFAFSGGSQDGKNRLDVQDNIQRVRSSDINIAAYLKRDPNQVTTTPKTRPHRLQHMQEDVDDLLMFYYEHHMIIPDSFRDVYASNIPDAYVKANFINRCAELKIECKLYEEQQKKDTKIMRSLGKKEIKRRRVWNILASSRKVPIEHSFNIGDRVNFLDEDINGIVVNVDNVNGFLDVEIESGFSITMPFSKCVSVVSVDMYFPERSKAKVQKNSSVSSVVPKAKPKDRNGEPSAESLAALADMFNKRK